MNQINNHPDPLVAAKIVDAEAAATKANLDRGMIGRAFGSRDNVPFNVAGFVVVATLVAIIWILLLGDFASHKDQIAVLSPILTLFGGYLFGQKSKD
jgi:hypothetical protein